MRIDPEILRAQCAAKGIRLDANETAVFARQLEHIQAETYDVLYPELKAMQACPVIGGIDPGASFFTYRGFDYAGKAKRIANGTDDSPRVDVQGAEVQSPIGGYGDSYAYSIHDLRASALANRSLGGIGMPLDQRRALAARDVLARTVDSIIAVGDPDDSRVPGFTNNSSVAQLYPGNGTAALALPNGNWPAATGAQILQDLQFAEAYIITASKGIHVPDTLALPPSLMGIVAVKPASDLIPDKSVLQVYLQNSRAIKSVSSVIEWYALETAGTARVTTSTTRMVMYQRSPQVLGSIVPLEFNQLPPEPRNYSFIINCEARCGGAVWFRPGAGVYIDGCGG